MESLNPNLKKYKDGHITPINEDIAPEKAEKANEYFKMEAEDKASSNEEDSKDIKPEIFRMDSLIERYETFLELWTAQKDADFNNAYIDVLRHIDQLETIDTNNINFKERLIKLKDILNKIDEYRS